MPDIADTIPYFESSTGDPFQRGHELGRRFAEEVANSVDFYRRLFAEDANLAPDDVVERGTQALSTIGDFRPQYRAEIEGMAEGSGQHAGWIAALNARTELLGGGRIAGVTPGECSLLAMVGPDGASASIAQNWDFHPGLAGSRIVVRHMYGDRWVTTFTEAGQLAKIGLNSDGLGVGINFLSSRGDGFGDGVPVHVLLRTILDEASTLAEARRLIRDAHVSASISITVAGLDEHGQFDAVAFEVWPEGVHEVWAAGNPRHVSHANHFVALIAHDDLFAAGEQGSFSASRFDQLEHAAQAENSSDLGSLLEVMARTDCPTDGQPLMRVVDLTVDWLQRAGTLATVALAVPGGDMVVVDPLSSPHQP